MRKDQCLTSSAGPRVKPEDRARRLGVFACFVSLSFAGLVVVARSLNPIPSRTRPLNSSAPMVLWLKPWESRSLPGLPRTKTSSSRYHDQKTPLPQRILRAKGSGFFCVFDNSVNLSKFFGHDSAPGFRGRITGIILNRAL